MEESKKHTETCIMLGLTVQAHEVSVFDVNIFPVLFLAFKQKVSDQKLVS